MFDSDLDIDHPYNQEVAQELGVTWDEGKQAYVDRDGLPTYDRFGQPL